MALTLNLWVELIIWKLILFFVSSRGEWEWLGRTRQRSASTPALLDLAAEQGRVPLGQSSGLVAPFFIWQPPSLGTLEPIGFGVCRSSCSSRMSEGAAVSMDFNPKGPSHGHPAEGLQLNSSQSFCQDYRSWPGTGFKHCYATRSNVVIRTRRIGPHPSLIDILWSLF